MTEKPPAGILRFIPALHDAAVVQQLVRPSRFRVAGIHPEPHHEDPNVGIATRREEIVLHPPGAAHAGRSCRRQEQNQTGVTGVRVEPRLELFNAAEIAQCRVRGRPSNGRMTCRKRDERVEETSGVEQASSRSHGTIETEAVNKPARRSTASSCDLLASSVIGTSGSRTSDAGSKPIRVIMYLRGIGLVSRKIA